MAQLSPVAGRTILDCIEPQLMERLKIPKNFIAYAFSLPHKLSQRQLDGIRDLLYQWARWDVLESLANYHSVVKSLLVVLKDRLVTHSHETSHTIAEEAVRALSQDVHVLHDQLVSMLRDPESWINFLACRGSLAQQLLDLLQDLLDSFPESPARSRLAKALERLSRVSGLHPTCFPLNGLEKVGQQIAAGAFGDIWQGLVRGQSVSVKIMRLFRDADMKYALQEFGHEALIWRQLSHPNLLPFFGLHYLDSRLCLVSPWMANGHILQFLETAPPDTDRVSLMLDVAMGLEYLHGKRVVHGDLKGMNILVTPSRRACVADFGLSTIADAMTLRFTHSSASPKGGTARYQAPELLSTDTSNHFGSDVYAFGCVCYEILTGKAPLYEIPRDVTVMIKVLEGIRPSRPETMPADDKLWLLMQDCWREKPCDRPSISEIVQRLVAIGAKAAESTTDWDETFSSRSRRSFQEWPLLPSVTAIERRIFGDAVVEGCPSCFPERPQEPIPTNGEDHHPTVEVYHAGFLNSPSPSPHPDHSDSEKTLAQPWDEFMFQNPPSPSPHPDHDDSERFLNRLRAQEFVAAIERNLKSFTLPATVPYRRFLPDLTSTDDDPKASNFLSTPPLQAAGRDDSTWVRHDRQSGVFGEERRPYEVQLAPARGNWARRTDLKRSHHDAGSTPPPSPPPLGYDLYMNAKKRRRDSVFGEPSSFVTSEPAKHGQHGATHGTTEKRNFFVTRIRKFNGLEPELHSPLFKGAVKGH